MYLYLRTDQWPTCRMHTHARIVKCGKDVGIRDYVRVCDYYYQHFPRHFRPRKREIQNRPSIECCSTVMCESGMELEFWHIHRLPTLKIRRKREWKKDSYSSSMAKSRHTLHFSSDFIAANVPLARRIYTHTPTEYKKNRFLPPKKSHVTLQARSYYLHDDHEAVNRHTEKHQVPWVSGGWKRLRKK